MSRTLSPHQSAKSVAVAVAVVISAVITLGLTGATARAATARTPHSGQAAWPVTPVQIVRGFDLPEHNWLPGHRGIDAATVPGQHLVSPFDGVVRFAGRVVDRDVLSLQLPGGLVLTFEPVSSNWEPGQAVSVGQPLGTVEPGGHCPQSCLHIGVIRDGAYVSPFTVFRRPSVRLKPLG